MPFLDSCLSLVLFFVDGGRAVAPICRFKVVETFASSGERHSTESSSVVKELAADDIDSVATVTTLCLSTEQDFGVA